MPQLPRGGDSARAREQIVEQWVTNQLLFQEARRRGLRDDPEVRRLLHDSEMSVLVSALVSSMFAAAEPVEPTQEQIREYYEKHRDRLRLHEPYARVRHLTTTSFDSAAGVHRRLGQALYGSNIDSVWSDLVEAYASDPVNASYLSNNFLPASRLFSDNPAMKERLAGLDEGDISPVIPQNGSFHVLQLVRRYPAGTTPRLDWISDRMRKRLVIQMRKQIYARQVERLRSEALAQNALEIR